ncbi:hypothetical protein NLI96_g5339 [Meripilus lineatus]|uniref:Zinc finger ZPR1-type domain-containing protein n=1 Tax=Meripilus lineatus TaxID=2056292 RepID=A0AAD5V313_9APHY|nr:hypothetical protein NLI96_g5339 [Physisporinus lineatus]
MSEAANPELFPSIRTVANETDKLPEPPEKPIHTPEGTDADDAEDRPVQEVESLCMNWSNKATIDFDTILPRSHYYVLPLGQSAVSSILWESFRPSIYPLFFTAEGAVYTVRILSREDLNRQLVKSATCTVTIPEFDLTIPASKGQLTTVEGLLRDITTDLSADQPLRKYQNESAYTKIETILTGLREILADDEEEEDADEITVGQVKVQKASEKDVPLKPFTVKLDDPSGNSFIEFVGGMSDPKWNMRTYHRTRQQNIDLHLIDPDAEAAPETISSLDDAIGGGLEGKNEEIYIFPGTCSSCGHKSDTLIKKVNIPYFQDVLIMSTNCELCGYRDNEVKSGGAISEQGKRITLKVEDRDDLSRDVLKSESCGLSIPEIDLVLQAGTLGGRFTTLEGILDQVYEELSIKVFADAKSDDGVFERFLQKLKEVKSVDRPFTIVLDDPLANSYLQNIYAPDPDPNMEIVMYDRTWEQNEELGLNDMKVEGYEGDPELVKKGPEEVKS